MVYFVVPNEKCFIIKTQMYYQKSHFRHFKVMKGGLLNIMIVVFHLFYFHCDSDIQLSAFWKGIPCSLKEKNEALC